MKGKKLLTAIIASAMISLVSIPSSLAIQEVISTDEVGIVYNLTKREVLQQLRGLAEKEVNEDGWYYIPKTKELIDVGTFTAPSRHSVDLYVLLDKKPKSKEVISYHIHPFDGRFHPPSPEDIAAGYDELNFFKQHGINIKEFIVVESGGYWSVNINKSLKAIEKYTFFREYLSIFFKHKTEFIPNYGQNKEDNLDQHIQDKLIKSFVKKVRGIGLHIKYHKF